MLFEIKFLYAKIKIQTLGVNNNSAFNPRNFNDGLCNGFDFG